VSATWASVIIVGAVTIGLKAIGSLALQDRQLPPRLNGMIELLAPVMLSALVVTNTFAGDHKLVLDPRAAGLAAAAISILLRAPLLVTVTVAAVTAALIRAL
jgi:branched-subunit amino acid transport protein